MAVFRIHCCIAGALLCTACAVKGTVKIPRSDATPPQAALDVVGMGGAWVLTQGKDPVTVEMGPEDSLVLIGLGEDRDGGVRELALAGNAVAVCRADTGQNSRSNSFLRRSIIPAFPSGVRVQGARITRLTVRVSDFRKLCGPGDLMSVTGAAGVRSVNFHGGSAMSPSLQFRFNEAEVPSKEPLVEPPASGAGRGASRGPAPAAGRSVPVAAHGAGLRREHRRAAKAGRVTQSLPKTQAIVADRTP